MNNLSLSTKNPQDLKNYEHSKTLIAEAQLSKAVFRPYSRILALANFGAGIASSVT